MKFFRSIRWRLQLWYGLLLCGILSGFSLAVFQLERVREFSRIDQELKQQANIVENATRPRAGKPQNERDEHRPRDLNFRTGEERLFEKDYYYVIWWSDNESITTTLNAPEKISQPNRKDQPVRLREPFRETYIWSAGGNCILVGRSIESDLEALHFFGWKLILAGFLVLSFGLIVGWWFVTRTIRPIEEISATAVKISSGDLSQRIKVSDPENELGKLAGVLNSTFAQLDASFAQQARFTADAAHELRTPVTVMLTQVQSAIDVSCPAEEHTEAFGSCQRAAQRMRGLIESLLHLARLDAGQEPMRKQAFPLDELLHECTNLVEPLAKTRGIRIFVTPSSIECHGDLDRLFHVVSNLLTNAIHHNKENGEVHVTAKRSERTISIEVTDNGPGIAPEHIDHIFERFYRIDKARASSGRTGLGLAISKAIIEAHGGNITAASKPGNGSTFVVTLPCDTPLSSSPNSTQN